MCILGEVSHTCEKCGEGFRRSSELKRHMQKHAEAPEAKVPVPLHICKWCGIRFSTGRALTIHLETHVEKTIEMSLWQPPKSDQFTQEKKRMVDQIVQDLGSGFTDNRAKTNQNTNIGFSQPQDLTTKSNTDNLEYPTNSFNGVQSTHAPTVSAMNIISTSSDELFGTENFGLQSESCLENGLAVTNDKDILLKESEVRLIPQAFGRESERIEVDISKVKQEQFEEESTDEKDDNEDFCADDDDEEVSNQEIDIADQDDDYGGDTDVEGDYNYVLPDYKTHDMIEVVNDSDEIKQEIVKSEKLSEDEEIENTVQSTQKSKKARTGKVVNVGKKRKQASPKKRQKILKTESMEGVSDAKPVEETSESAAPEKIVKHTEKKKESVSKKPSKVVQTRGKAKKPFDPDSLYCRQCDKRFSHNSAMKKHKNLHSGLFTCGTCAKAFSCQSSLDSHMHIHEGRRVRDAKCNVCDKEFYDVSSLNKHVKTVHMDFKPFSCPMCDRRFSERKTLAEHVRVHTGERPFTCEVGV